jgi:ADP-heptose:LPS heptosyltransferase
LSVCHGGQADDGIIAQGRDSFQRHVACALHSPFIVLFGQDRADQTGDRRFVGKDADDVCPAFDLAIQ